MKNLKGISLAITMLISFVGFGQEKVDSIQKKIPLMRCQSSIQSSNEPLIIIDQMIINSEILEEINPSNIESVDVIKGLKAEVLYGIRGINGVIVIKTKNLSKREVRKLKKQSKQVLKNQTIIRN